MGTLHRTAMSGLNVVDTRSADCFIFRHASLLGNQIWGILVIISRYDICLPPHHRYLGTPTMVWCLRYDFSGYAGLTTFQAKYIIFR
jgi:hypothetical protein